MLPHFSPEHLREVGLYATALLRAALRDEPLPAAIAERWRPYHAPLGDAAPGRRALLPIAAEIGAGGAAVRTARLVAPRLPLALSESALFPVPANSPTPTAPWADAEGQLARAVELAARATGAAEARAAFEPLFFTMQRLGTNLPATLGGETLSLFRQFALATALYAASGGGDAPAPTFTVIGSDTPGIQRFLGAGTTSSGAARRLRGRSAFLQLVTEATAQRLLDTLGLPRANLLYAAGGNLFLLAPAGVSATLESLRADLSAALAAGTGAELDQVIAWEEIAGLGFVGEPRAARLALGRKLAAARFRPYGAVLGGASATPEDRAGAHAQLFAPVYHSEDAADPNAETPYDALAYEIAAAHSGAPHFLHRCRTALVPGDPPWRRALHTLSGGWRYEFSGRPRSPGAPLADLADALNRPELVPDGATGFRFLATTTPRADEGSGIRELGTIADATPMGRIGVLRMDVDNLGAIFTRELTGGLAALCSLSAALDRFFAGWLNELCARAEAPVPAARALQGTARAIAEEGGRGDLLYTIYSGGDDLFVVGAWDRLPPLAEAIRIELGRYCAGHPQVTLSGGIAIADAHYPLYQLAGHAHDALEGAKRYRSPSDGRGKDALGFLGDTMSWPAFAMARDLTTGLLGTAREPSALIGRLRDLALLNAAERERFAALVGPVPVGGPTVFGRAQWRGLVALQRALEQERAGDNDLRALLERYTAQLVDGTLTPHLELVARWADFLWRPCQGGGEGR